MRYKFRTDDEQFAIWHSQHKKLVLSDLINKKSTLCTGYAFLVKELAGLAGIECEVIDGFGKVGNKSLKNMKIPNHAWNAVKLNGKWYLCDPTWSSGFIDGDTYLFKFNYNDAYFLMDPQVFAKEHRPIDEKWLLTSTDKKFPVTASSGY